MKKAIHSAQLNVRIIHLTINADTLAVGGEDQRLVEKVVVVDDIVSVTLNGFARPKGGRSIGVMGLFPAAANPQSYTFKSSNTSVINLEVLVAEAAHGSFGLTLLVNDNRNLYAK